MSLSRLCVVLLAGLLAWATPATGNVPGDDIEASPRYAGIVMDARTGEVLIAHNADARRHPASLTKVMTVFMMFEAIGQGRMTFATPIVMTRTAAQRPPSRLGLPVGARISAEAAILALLTRSANDVAAAVAEHMAGSEAAFAQRMTARAREIGMASTVFRNASGLPDDAQVTTARDMATLARRLMQDFPQHYHYFSTTHFRHGERLIRSHNGMLADYPGVDGIKTGFINASGFNILTSAERGGLRLIGAVFGGDNWRQRNEQMANLLDEGFARRGILAIPPEAMAAAASQRIMTARPPRAERRAGTPARQVAGSR